MGIRFRQKIKILPGIHVNITGNGITSLSIGSPGSTFNINRDLTTKNTINIPGSGLSYQHTIYKNKKQITPQDRHHENEPALDFQHYKAQMLPITSKYHIADWCQPDFKEIAEHLISYNQRLELLIEERSSLVADLKSKNRFSMIDRFIKMVNRRKWEEIQKSKEHIEVSIQGIDADLSNRESALTWDIPPMLNKCHKHISEQFILFAQQNTPLWHINGQQSIDEAHFRASYNSVLNRSAAKFSHGWPDFLPKEKGLTDISVPLIKSEDGFAIYFFPFFVAIEIDHEFGLLSPLNVTIKQIEHSFSVIEESPPGGVRITDYTYKYINKDGSPDLRFKDNPKLPIVSYDVIEISISDGPAKILHFPTDLSSVLFCSNFYDETGGSWQNFCNWFRYSKLLISFENIEAKPVKWKLRHEPAYGKNSSMDYIGASLPNGDEFFVLAFAHEVKQFWLGLSAKPLEVLFKAAETANDERATDVKIWLDEKPIEIIGNQYVSQITPEQASFKVLGLLLDFSDSDSPIRKIRESKNILIYIRNSKEKPILLRLSLDDAQPLMTELINRSSITDWKF
jgi:hypothetical protein